jgi:hypothetical protein
VARRRGRWRHARSSEKARALFGGYALGALTMAMFAAIPREED